jgi:glycosyltransferase involved in cell wall biosynthesis
LTNKLPQLGIAVIIPCLNEAASIRQVVLDVKRHLPEARIYVYDNESTDDTLKIAKAAGAIVRSEKCRGKGNVVRRMFTDIDADIYFMIDGDQTYDLTNMDYHVNALLTEYVDMVVGARIPEKENIYRPGHYLGNKFFNYSLNIIFKSNFTDIFSGYRVMTRRFVKTFAAVTKGFEIETELSVHALELRVEVKEFGVLYSQRIEGSHSKLNTIKDGIAILFVMYTLFREANPMKFYSLVSLVLVLIASVLGYPLIMTFLKTGMVPRVPTAILSSALMVLAGVGVVNGLILENISKTRRDLKRIAFLKFNSPFSSY